MIPFLLAFFLLGSAYQAQDKYDYCKSQEFKGEYCKLQKKLSKLK